MDPMTECEYEKLEKASESIVSNVLPYGALSTPMRRSSCTALRWLSRLSLVITSDRIRSASRKSPRSSWFAGSVSK